MQRIKRLAIFHCLIASLILLPIIVYSEGERIDYDLDDDGLIEINDIDDFNEIKSSWGSSSMLYGSSSGCPNDFCMGYELAQSIDFKYTRGKNPRLSRQVFEGNGHTLSNLNISRGDGTGLFSYIYSSTIRNLNIITDDRTIRGQVRVGTLAGEMNDGLILNCRVKAIISGSLEVGGFIGVARNVSFVNSHFEGAVSGSGILGGLAGIAKNVSVYASSVKLDIVSRSYVHGSFLGNSWDADIVASQAEASFPELGRAYAFADSGLVEASYYTNPILGLSKPKTVVVNGVEAQADIDEITTITVSSRWGVYTDEVGNTVWQFNTEGELPTIRQNLVFSGVDDDGDFIINLLDSFPDNKAASVDRDKDGFPDRWNFACLQECQAESGLELDQNIEPLVKTAGIQIEPSAGAMSVLELFTLLITLCVSLSAPVIARKFM